MPCDVLFCCLPFWDRIRRLFMSLVRGVVYSLIGIKILRGGLRHTFAVRFYFNIAPLQATCSLSFFYLTAFYCRDFVVCLASGRILAQSRFLSLNLSHLEVYQHLLIHRRCSNNYIQQLLQTSQCLLPVWLNGRQNISLA
jgi:hypothetical protein